MSEGYTGAQAQADPFDAARRGDVVALSAALDAGLACDVRNERGDTLLMLAAYHCHQDAVRALLQRGADPNVANEKGQKPLAGVCWKGSEPVARLLIEHGAAVDDGGVGMTPLMLAAMSGHLPVVRLLVAAGADVTVRSGSGHTARELAANIRAATIIRCLDEAAGAA